jgi:hypothetical protein
MTIDHGPQPARTDKHPLQEGLEKPPVSPPEGERDSDRAQLIQTNTETLAGAPPSGGSGIDQGSQSDGGNEHRSNRGRDIILGTLASGLVTVIVIAGGNKFINSDKGGSAENPAPNPDRTVSAPANPVETRAVGPVDPIELVGKPEAKSIDNLNVKPSKEVINEALKGVPVSEYKTPQEAFVQLANIYNVLELSATADNSTQPQDTPESIQLRDKLQSKLYTQEVIDDGQFAQENLVRVNLGSILESVNEYEVTTDGPLTWHNDFNVSSIEQNGTNSFEVKAINTLYSNFGTTEGLDFSHMIKNVDKSKQGLPVSIEMVKDDGYWHWSSYETN